MPPTTRCRRRRSAELHERFADWLAAHDLVEGAEIVGYHLEQAHGYRSELDSSDPAIEGLARRASDQLAAAGRGAVDRGDFNAARSLLRRAVDLLPERDESRLALAPELAEALAESGTRTRRWRVVSEARAALDPRTRAQATVMTATMALVGG